MEDISDGEDDLSDFEFDLDDYSPSSFFNDVEVSSVFFSVVEEVVIIPSPNKLSVSCFLRWARILVSLLDENEPRPKENTGP